MFYSNNHMNEDFKMYHVQLVVNLKKFSSPLLGGRAYVKNHWNKVIRHGYKDYGQSLDTFIRYIYVTKVGLVAN